MNFRTIVATLALIALPATAAVPGRVEPTIDGLMRLAYNTQTLARYSLQGSSDEPVDVSARAIDWKIAPPGWVRAGAWTSPYGRNLRLGLSTLHLAVELTNLSKPDCRALLAATPALDRVALAALAVDTPEAPAASGDDAAPEDSAPDDAADTPFATPPDSLDEEAAAKSCSAGSRVTFFFPLKP